MSYTVEQFEDAVLTALAPLKVGYATKEGDPAVYGTVREIKTYQGELDDEEALAAALRLFPAIICVYGGSVYAAHGPRKVETLSFILFVGDRNLRSEAAARRGGAGPGAYALLKGVRDLLTGTQLLAGTEPLEVVRALPVWFGGGMSIYSTEFETSQGHLYP